MAWTDWWPLAQDRGAARGVDPALVMAVIRAESGGDPNAVSGAGAQGLMQLMPATAAGLGVTNPFDPAQNVDAGARYLAAMIGSFGLEGGIAAYNAGPGNVAHYGGVPPFAETQTYVARVLGYYRELAGAAPAPSDPIAQPAPTDASPALAFAVAAFALLVLLG